MKGQAVHAWPADLCAGSCGGHPAILMDCKAVKPQLSALRAAGPGLCTLQVQIWLHLHTHGLSGTCSTPSKAQNFHAVNLATAA